MRLLIDAALHGAGLAIVMEDMAAPFLAMDAWSGYWKTGARRSPATISITLTGATPPRRSLPLLEELRATLIYKQGKWAPRRSPAWMSGEVQCASHCQAIRAT